MSDRSDPPVRDGPGAAPAQPTESERARYHRLFQQAPGYVAILQGPDFVFEVVNDGYCALVGLPRERLLGKPLWDALPELRGQGFEELLETIRRSGEPYVGRGRRLRVPDPDRGGVRIHYVDFSYQPVFEPDGTVGAVFAQGHDVTAAFESQKQLAEKVRELEQVREGQSLRLQLFDRLRREVDPDAMFRHSAELIGRHLRATRVCHGEYDVVAEQVTLHSNYVDGIAPLVGTYPVAAFGASNFATLEAGRPWVNHDVVNDPRTAAPEIQPNFERIGVRSGFAVPLARQGATIGCLFVSDSQPRRWRDDEIELVQDVLERTRNAVDRTRAEEALREADRRKDDFLAMLAHELRNPIAPVSAAAALLRMDPSDAERARRASDVISRQVDHMVGLVDDLLDVSRVNRGLIELARDEVDIRQVVADAIEQVRPIVEERGHRLLVNQTSERCFVVGDAKRLVQVLANLLTNAAKYTPPGGNIRVRVATTRSRVVVRVIDDGIGISADLLPSVFALFAQGSRSPDRSLGGLGMGLSLVRSLVGLHGGTVVAQSRGLGHGSTFTVGLPRLLRAAREATAPPEPAAIAGAGSSGLRVLVVDDNVDAAETLAYLLDASGHRTAVENDPFAALARARDEAFDAMLLDIGLPGIDGNELARRLRRLPGPRPYLVAITGYGRADDERQAREAGFDEFLVKPANPARLLALLATVSR